MDNNTDNNMDNSMDNSQNNTLDTIPAGSPETTEIFNDADETCVEVSTDLDETVSEEVSTESDVKPTEAYTDPNAGQQYRSADQAGQSNQYGQYQSYNQQNSQYGQYQQQNQYGQYQQPNQNWGQDNYNYNVGNNMGYNRSYDTGMDNSPMTMGDWVLTILALMIPCAGIVLYFVWAFGKNGNVNRRNYCRAYLIIAGITLAIYIVLFGILGVAIAGSFHY